MTADTHLATDFYMTARGVVAARLLRERLTTIWPDLSGRSILGIGYTVPYLRAWREGAARCVAATPSPTSVPRWPLGNPSLSCAVEEEQLPFPDLSFDRILLVHGVEAADNARRLLREVWRVLKDDGHLLVVTPNRVGMWAHVESTPFGQGQPYSSGQIGRLLASSLFRVEQREGGLYMPPTNLRLLLRGGQIWERAGEHLLPQLAGVTITEAVKDVYAAMPRRPVPRRRLVLSEAA